MVEMQWFGKQASETDVMRHSFFFFFLCFLGPDLQHMEVPRLVVELELHRRPTPQPQQHRIWATSATYTTAHSNTGSLLHWARPGIEPQPSWIPVGFLTHWATTGTLPMFVFKLTKVFAFTCSSYSRAPFLSTRIHEGRKENTVSQ